MTSSSRRALPWLLAAGAHSAALIVLALALGSSASELAVPRLNVSLIEGPLPGPGGSIPAGKSPRSSFPGMPARAAGSRQADSRAPTGEEGGTRSPAPAQAGSAETSQVSAREVSADGAAMDAGQGTPPAVSNGDASFGQGGVSWGWQGQPRTLVRRREPEFPAALRAAGQEVEGEAKITVAPSGMVTRVEITRSSGYIEIDASVEAALHDYLFSRVDGRVDSVGTIPFRFRLEKQD